jgi:hypothetical protein
VEQITCVIFKDKKKWLSDIGQPFFLTFDSGEGTWTPDPADMSRLLYHLSYAAIFLTPKAIDTISIGFKVVNIGHL